jgi:hypothetical protein
MISALHPKYEKSYIFFHRARIYGILLRQSSVSLMLGVSYILWSSCLTTK